MSTIAPGAKTELPTRTLIRPRPIAGLSSEIVPGLGERGTCPQPKLVPQTPATVARPAEYQRSRARFEQSKGSCGSPVPCLGHQQMAAPAAKARRPLAATLSAKGTTSTAPGSAEQSQAATAREAANAGNPPGRFQTGHFNTNRFPLGQACVGFDQRLRLEDWARSYGIAQR
jgi:hypothetical protein